MLAFWPSDAVLVATQASLVCGPRPRLPAALARLRSSAWAWLLLPVSLGGTIAVLAVAPGLGLGYAWLAAVGVPLMAAVAAGAALPDRLPAGLRITVAILGTAVLLGLGWGLRGELVGQAAASALTALSACAVASYLAALAPAPLLKVGLVVMAALDAVLVFSQALAGPNDTLNAASPGAGLPHLQVAVFGSALIGYGDLFVAAVLGCLVAPRRRWPVALLVLALSAVFDLLFLVVDELPATVPVAVALLLVEVCRRRWGQPGPRDPGAVGHHGQRGGVVQDRGQHG
ncbi:MAG: hypothetical protein QM638_15460 [Nocardioides sp.]|uniref:hypothetical protein n=1 Tax=Nocardioides sp. TaxID=35761 RepID=UPI0039E3D88D